ncbi:MAG: F0F1 ATP synthase subunit delta [Anaerolineae bacterium]|nr:F0F1 ATP synthase subunit delta [Anaerolineae bacterium]
MLELDLATVIFQIINFLVLAWLLYRFLFAPAMHNIQARTAEKDRLLQELKVDREAAETLRLELEARLAQAEEEANAIIMAAQNQAEEERVAMFKETQTEVRRILSEAQVDAYNLKQQAVDEFHDDLLRAVLDVSGLVIERIAPPELQDKMVKQLNDRIWELGRSEMRMVETLRRSLGERIPTVLAQTARPLSSEQQGILVRTFSALADRNVNLDIKVDPSMGAGVRVRIGDIVVDNSIAGKLNALRDTVADALKERVRHDERSATTEHGSPI